MEDLELSLNLNKEDSILSNHMNSFVNHLLDSDSDCSAFQEEVKVAPLVPQQTEKTSIGFKFFSDKESTNVIDIKHSKSSENDISITKRSTGTENNNNKIGAQGSASNDEDSTEKIFGHNEENYVKRENSQSNFTKYDNSKEASKDDDFKGNNEEVKEKATNKKPKTKKDTKKKKTKLNNNNPVFFPSNNKFLQTEIPNNNQLNNGGTYDFTRIQNPLSININTIYNYNYNPNAYNFNTSNNNFYLNTNKNYINEENYNNFVQNNNGSLTNPCTCFSNDNMFFGKRICNIHSNQINNKYFQENLLERNNNMYLNQMIPVFNREYQMPEYTLNISNSNTINHYNNLQYQREIVKRQLELVKKANPNLAKKIQNDIMEKSCQSTVPLSNLSYTNSCFTTSNENQATDTIKVNIKDLKGFDAKQTQKYMLNLKSQELYSLCCNKSGSILFLKAIKLSNPKELHMYYEKLKEHFGKLYKKEFGSCCMKGIIKYIPISKRTELIKDLKFYFNKMIVNEFGSNIVKYLVESSNNNNFDRDVEEKLVCSLLTNTPDKILFHETGSSQVCKIISYFKEENLIELLNLIIDKTIPLIMNSNTSKIMKFFIMKFQHFESAPIAYSLDNQTKVFEKIELLRKKFLTILQVNLLKVLQSDSLTSIVIDAIKHWGFKYCNILMLEIQYYYKDLIENPNGFNLVKSIIPVEKK